MFETFWAKTNPKPSLIGALMYEPSAANVSGAVNEAAPKFQCYSLIPTDDSLPSDQYQHQLNSLTLHW